LRPLSAAADRAALNASIAAFNESQADEANATQTEAANATETEIVNTTVTTTLMTTTTLRHTTTVTAMTTTSTPAPTTATTTTQAGVPNVGDAFATTAPNLEAQGCCFAVLIDENGAAYNLRTWSSVRTACFVNAPWVQPADAAAWTAGDCPMTAEEAGQWLQATPVVVPHYATVTESIPPAEAIAFNSTDHVDEDAESTEIAEAAAEAVEDDEVLKRLRPEAQVTTTAAAVPAAPGAVA